MAELKQAVEAVKSYTGPTINYKRGLVYDPSLGNKVRITVVATGFEVLNLPDVDGNNIIIPGRGDETVVRPDPIRPRNPEEGKIPSVLEFKPEKRVAGTKPVLVTDDESEIIELESIPAYERKNRKKNPGITTNSITLAITNTGERPAITTNNRYLHQTQD